MITINKMYVLILLLLTPIQSYASKNSVFEDNKQFNKTTRKCTDPANLTNNNVACFIAKDNRLENKPIEFVFKKPDTAEFLKNKKIRRFDSNDNNLSDARARKVRKFTELHFTKANHRAAYEALIAKGVKNPTQFEIQSMENIMAVIENIEIFRKSKTQ